MKLGRGFAVALFAVLVVGIGTDEARATTICVPAFTAACPNDGSNVVEADVEKAMGIDGWDGEPDQVIIAGGTYVETGSFEPGGGLKSPNTFEPEGADDLIVTGAGQSATYLTAAGGENEYLVNLGAGGNVRDITVRELTLRVPAAAKDNAGAGIQLFHGDLLEDIEVESQNNGSDAVVASDPGNVARNVSVHGGGIEGKVTVGFRVTSPSGSTLVVENSYLEEAAWNFAASAKEAQLTARGIFAARTRTYGAQASAGTVHVENSVIAMEDGIGLAVSPAAEDAAIEADHITLIDEFTNPATQIKQFNPTAGDGTITVSNSIFNGFGSGYEIESAGGTGVLHIEARYSNLPLTGTAIGGTHDFGTGNISADPLFREDLSLSSASPSIDAGDPAGGGLTTDFLGQPRPNDGNGDGVAVRDQGAFEYQRPVPPSAGGGGSSGGGQSPDKIPPQTKIAKGPGAKLAHGKAKFSFRSSELGSTFVCKLDKRKARPCKSPRSYTGLKAGRHLFKVWAIDKAGNKDPTPAKRRFRVPA